MVARMRRLGLIVAVVTLLLDQLSKFWLLEIVALRSQPRIIEIFANFNLVMVWNRGVSFGLFSQDSDAGRWLLITVALLITAFVAKLLWRVESRPQAIAFGLIIGGAIGNVIDRLRFGAVADFFDVHLAGYHWPAFNVADSAIVVGVGLFIIDTLRRGRNVPHTTVEKGKSK